MQFNFIQQRIQDEILVITNKYDYESEKLDIERSRKKTQIGELKSNTDIFSKFYFFQYCMISGKRLIMEERLAEMIEEIGADRLRPIVKPTVHSVLVSTNTSVEPGLQIHHRRFVFQNMKGAYLTD